MTLYGITYEKKKKKALKWEHSLQCKIIYSECTFISFNIK